MILMDSQKFPLSPLCTSLATESNLLEHDNIQKHKICPPKRKLSLKRFKILLLAQLAFQPWIVAICGNAIIRQTNQWKRQGLDIDFKVALGIEMVFHVREFVLGTIFTTLLWCSFTSERLFQLSDVWGPNLTPSLTPSLVSVLSKHRKACCYPGIRCSPQTPTYNIFIISCLPGTMYMDSISMMQPMWDTVFRGLQSRESECNYRVFKALAHHSDQNLLLPIEPKRGDVVLLVGHENHSNFLNRCEQIYAKREVYCIWYFSEHERNKEAANYSKHLGLCEIWEYTQGNVPIAPVVRYVPAGFLPHAESVEENDRVVMESINFFRSLAKMNNLTNSSFSSSELTLQFVGNMNQNNVPRQICWRHLQRVAPFKTFVSSGVWGMNAWRTLSKRKGAIYLNIHRHCNQSNMYVNLQRPLETVRLSSLLSAGAVVISEITNEKDMKAFDGLVLFEANLFTNFERWSWKLRQILSDPVAFSDWQLSSYTSFKKKFSPRQVLLDANVWDGGLETREARFCSNQ